MKSMIDKANKGEEEEDDIEVIDCPGNERSSNRRFKQDI